MLALLAHETGSPPLEWYWYVIGFGGQATFGSRFYIQWLASERARRSVVPKIFWHLSLVGSLLLLCYAIRNTDPVFITGQATGFLVYSRNLYFVKLAEAKTAGSEPGRSTPTEEKTEEKNDSHDAD